MPSRTRSDTRSKSAKSNGSGETKAPPKPSRVAEERLRSFLERIESVEAEIRSLNRDKAEIYAEAKGSGFDTAVMKVQIKRRRQAPEVVALADQLLTTYERAVGGGYFNGEDETEAARNQAREHGRADARDGTNFHEFMYPPGNDGHADYWLGRQDVGMAGTEASAIAQ